MAQANIQLPMIAFGEHMNLRIAPKRDVITLHYDNGNSQDPARCE